MKFSTKSSYGLRAMIQLARNYKKGSLSLTKIAKSEGISLGYLERLVAQLKNKDLVKSLRGVSGGYSLSRSPQKISIREIFEALEGSLAPYYCAEMGSKCLRDCGARQVWQKLDEAIMTTLSKIKLNDLTK